MDSLNGGVSLLDSGDGATLVNGCGAHYILCMSNGYSLCGGGDDAAWRERMESESGFNWTPHIKSHSAFPVSSRPMKENQEHITRWLDINSCLREVGHNLQANHLSVSVTGHMTSHMILRIHDLSQSVFLPPSLPTDGISIIQMHLFIHQWIQNRCSLINSIRLSGSTIQAQANKGMNARSL